MVSKRYKWEPEYTEEQPVQILNIVIQGMLSRSHCTNAFSNIV